jgi:predicted permease
MNGTRFAEALWQDIRYGLRMLRKSPGFTAVAVLTLALGIGANTAIFSLIDALLLKSLPVQDPQELVLLRWSARKSPEFHNTSSYGDCISKIGGDNASSCSFSRPFFETLRRQASMLANVTAFGGGIQLNLIGNGPARIVRGHIVSGNYFETLGIRPAIGRMLSPADDVPAAAPVMVLNYGYWQSAFGGDPTVVGKTVSLNGVQTTIVGVAEQRFVSFTPGAVFDGWLPISLRPALSPTWNPKRDAADSAWLVIVGRLKPDVSREKAEAAVSLIFRNEMVHGATPLSKEEDAPAVALVPAQSGLMGARRAYSSPLFILMLAVGIILLIACANVAGLLLSRSAARQKEMALRLALGAGRWRIVRQLLTESLLLSVMGGALGILVAYWGSHSILALVASNSSRPIGLSPSMDGRMLLFTFLVAIVTGMLFGLAPAVRGMRVDLTPALKEGTSSSAGTGRARRLWFNVGNSLVVAQVALTMVVLVGAGLLVRTLQNLRNIDPGFDAANVLNFAINPNLSGYKGVRIDNLYSTLLGKLSAIPGVTSTSYSEMTLLGGSLSRTSFPFKGIPGKTSANMDYFPVGPNFFATMKIPFLHGRDFAPADFAVAAQYESPGTDPKPPMPVIVNESFVRAYLGNVEPVGQNFGLSDGSDKREGKSSGYVVVGVVRDARYNSLRRKIDPTGYVPAQGYGVSFELRTAMDPASIIPTVRNIVNQTDSNLPIFEMKTEAQAIDQLLFQERLMARLSSIFGALALVLACVGLFGLLSYEVTRRTREIGIRMALGAQQGSVLRIVIGQGVVLTAVGAAVGIGAAIGVTRYLSAMLFDVKPGDPITLAATALILMIVALVACYVPARRATQVDPMIALRNE